MIRNMLRNLAATIKVRGWRLTAGIALLVFSCSVAQAGSFQPVYARKAMVVTAESHATDIGVEVLQNGGNAVDAAVAVGLALAVTEPNAGNLGGGGFMLIRFANGRSTFIDFRERAPAAAGRDMYLDESGNATDQSRVGYRAVAVPGTVRGFEFALKKYGTKKWKALVAPAERIARDGFAVTWDLAESLRENQRLSKFPESAKIFKNRGRGFQLGDILRQRDLAKTLKRLAENGPDEFYRGRTAKLIAADMKANNGLISLADLEKYQPTERQALKRSYGDFEVLSAPPPSSGGAGIIQMLNMLEGAKLAEHGAGSAAAIHQVSEVMRRFFADRARYFGDTDFVKIPLNGMLSKKYAKRRAKTIKPNRATPSADVGDGNPAGYESDETTHYSIVDAKGNAVSVTYTLNGGFGSSVTAKGTGVLLNNEMDDFTVKPGSPNAYGLLQSENNAIEPGKRPLSAMTPTIVSENGKLRLVLGAPGGPTIISTVLQTILNVVEFDMNVQQAVDYPRFHHQWMPDLLYMEAHGFSPDTVDALKRKGHKIDFNRALGNVMAIEVEGDYLAGAADSRSEGTAAGY
jgi:gamma-glutamyltranspeptidase/glutathione hydrolase